RARNPKKVQAALEKLKTSRMSLQDALKKISDAEPFHSEFVANAMGLARRYCEHADKRARLAEECLRSGEAWDNDEALNAENNRTDNARKNYEAKLHRADE